MSTVLVVTGGPDHAHDFAASSAALAGVLRSAGHDVRVTDDVEAAFCGLAGPRPPATVVVNALRWRMLGAAYDRWRDRWAYSPSPEARRAITHYVHAGGGLLGVHTASICFDDWPQWGDLLGGRWVWGVSSHPPVGPVTVRRTGVAHPVVDDLPDSFATVDEVYGDQQLAEGTVVLAVAKRHAGDADQPVVWAAERGEGRVVYVALGHDAPALAAGTPARLVAGAVAWTTRAV